MYAGERGDSAAGGPGAGYRDPTAGGMAVSYVAGGGEPVTWAKPASAVFQSHWSNEMMDSIARPGGACDMSSATHSTSLGSAPGVMRGDSTRTNKFVRATRHYGM